MATPSIPTWELTDLATLAAGGKLNGVAPIDLAAIDEAESGGEKGGAGVNSEGYGGYFGLGAGTQYPTGSISGAQLNENNSASFEAQAQVASGEFASLLKSHGGDALTAEKAYQGGSSEGDTIMAELGITGAAQTPGKTVDTGAPTSPSSNSQPAAPTGLVGFVEGLPGDVASLGGDVIGAAAGALWSLIGNYVIAVFCLLVALILVYHLVTGQNAVKTGFKAGADSLKGAAQAAAA